MLDNTARQIWLGRCLGYPELNYLHLPLAMNADGRKLSKQNFAQPLNPNNASELLSQAAQALNQPSLDLDRPLTMLAQAVAQWQRERIPQGMMLSQIYQ